MSTPQAPAEASRIEGQAVHLVCWYCGTCHEHPEPTRNWGTTMANSRQLQIYCDFTMAFTMVYNYEYIAGQILRTSFFPKFQNLYLEHKKNIYLEHHWCVLSLNLEHQKTIYIEHLLIFRVLRTLKKKHILRTS